MVSGYFPHYTNVVNAFPFDCMHKNGEFVLISMDSWRTNVTGRFNQGFCACRFVCVSVGVFAERKKPLSSQNFFEFYKMFIFMWRLRVNHEAFLYNIIKLSSLNSVSSPSSLQIVYSIWTELKILQFILIWKFFVLEYCCAVHNGNYLVDRVYYWNI